MTNKTPTLSDKKLKTGFQQKEKFKAVCKCGHDHVNFIGDRGEYEDDIYYEIIDGCCYCDCERFKLAGSRLTEEKTNGKE